jgi:hypothetical protein
MEDFIADLVASPFVSAPAEEVDELMAQYSALSTVLDRHAPLKRKRVIVRPDNPWFTDEISVARRDKRKREREWMKQSS